MQDKWHKFSTLERDSKERYCGRINIIDVWKYSPAELVVHAAPAALRDKKTFMLAAVSVCGH